MNARMPSLPLPSADRRALMAGAPRAGRRAGRPASSSSRLGRRQRLRGALRPGPAAMRIASSRHASCAVTAIDQPPLVALSC